MESIIKWQTGEPLKFGFDRIEEIAEHYHRFLVEEDIVIKDNIVI